MSLPDDRPCLGLPTEVFFPQPGGTGYALAFAACRQCAYRVECLHEFYGQPDVAGMKLAGTGCWGGTRASERVDRREAFRIARQGRPEWGGDAVNVQPSPLDLPLDEPVADGLPKPRTGPRPRHGGEAAYVKYGCRCSVCVDAQRARWRRSDDLRRQRQRGDGSSEAA